MNTKENNKKEDCGCATSDESLVLCPHCNTKGLDVQGVTIKAQLKKEKFETMTSSKDDFNFCTTPKCDTVYYSNDGKETFAQADIKSKITSKNDDPKTPLCYCKKLLKENVIEMINNKEEDIPTKIKNIVSEGKTFCEKSNPRGTCCTEDMARFLADYGLDYNSAKSSSCGDSSSQESSSCGTNTEVKEKTSCCGDEKTEEKAESKSSCCS